MVSVNVQKNLTIDFAIPRSSASSNYDCLAIVSMVAKKLKLRITVTTVVGMIVVTNVLFTGDLT